MSIVFPLVYFDCFFVKIKRKIVGTSDEEKNGEFDARLLGFETIEKHPLENIAFIFFPIPTCADFVERFKIRECSDENRQRPTNTKV